MYHFSFTLHDPMQKIMFAALRNCRESFTRIAEASTNIDVRVRMRRRASDIAALETVLELGSFTEGDNEHRFEFALHDEQAADLMRALSSEHSNALSMYHTYKGKYEPVAQEYALLAARLETIVHMLFTHASVYGDYYLTEGRVQPYVAQRNGSYFHHFGLPEYDSKRPVITDSIRSQAQPIVDALNARTMTEAEATAALDRIKW